MTAQDLLRASQTINAAALAAENAKFLKKKKKNMKDFIDIGTENIVGSELIKDMGVDW